MKTTRNNLIISLDERMTALRAAHRHPFRRPALTRIAAMRWESLRTGLEESMPC
jgi:hypothetical protein